MNYQQQVIDRSNSAFWDELCGSSLARALGIIDVSKESLNRFDQTYFDYYPYLNRYVLEEKLEGAALTLLDQPDPAVQQYERKELDRLRDDHRCDGHSLFRKCGGLLPGLLGFRLYEAGTAAARIWNVRARYG